MTPYLIVSSSFQPTQGIEWLCLEADFKMQRDTSGGTEIADQSDGLAGLDIVSLLDYEI
jgi:hypothetical protein